MSRLGSFHEDANCVVVGASGGIGTALTNLLVTDGRVGRTYALSRSPLPLVSGKQSSYTIDITDEASIASAAETVGEQASLDLVIVATGILHRGEELNPEKRMGELDARAMHDVYTINTVGPALVAKHFLPKMRRGHKTVFAAISARVGSIGDNRLGGWLSYRTSKSALNMALKTMSVEQARRHPDCVVAALHPGTVDTVLSRPFQRNVPEDRLFTPGQAAAYLLDVVNGLTPADTGGFFAWDGSRIEY